MKRSFYILSLLLILNGTLLTGCGKQPSNNGLKVVATTTIVGDIVRQVGGDRISLTVLLPTGADPHTYEPRPQDVAAIHDAHIIFLNGLELEHSLEPIISANATGVVMAVSDGISVLPFLAAGDEEHAAGDPHTWMDPNNVKIWVENIRQALTDIDPSGREVYKGNAEAYTHKLTELDEWITQEVAQIPTDNRKLVTDHESMGYFADRYGFELAGLLLQSLSTNASASASDLAKVEEAIKLMGIRTIFMEVGANDTLALQVAADTGVSVVSIYSGSLGAAKSGAESYLNFMHFNVNAIVEGLRK